MLTPAARALGTAAELRFGSRLPDSFGGTGEVYDIDRVEALLQRAMPDKKAEIALMARGYRDGCPVKLPPSCASDRLTILEARTEEVRDEAYVPRPPSPPISQRRDPYHVVFEMPAKADYVLFFNGRDVDANGNMALMGLGVRDGADPKLDLSPYRTSGTVEAHRIAARDRCQKGPQLVRFQEANDSEFDPGDPVYVVALDSAGRLVDHDYRTRPENELTVRYFPPKRGPDGRPLTPLTPDTDQPENQPRSHQTGHHLDTTPPAVHRDRVRAQLFLPRDFSPANWWHEPVSPGGAQLTLTIAPGAIFEPGSQATLSLEPSVGLGSSVSTEISSAESSMASIGRLPGNKTAYTKVDLGAQSLLTVFQRRLILSSSGPARGRDQARAEIPLSTRLLPKEGAYIVDGQTLSSVADYSQTIDPLSQGASFTSGLCLGKRPVHDGCHERNSDEPRRYDLRIPAGFVQGAKDGDLKGVRIEVGYADQTGWHPTSSRRLAGCGMSSSLEMCVDVPAGNTFENGGGRLELRVYSPESLPLRRYAIAAKAIDWDADLF